MKLLLLFSLSGFLLLPAQDSIQVEVTGDIQFKDTGIDVKAGDDLHFTVAGSLQYPGAKTGPEGFTRSFRDLIKNYPVNEAGRGALIGRIGNEDAARAFLIGPTGTKKAPITGRLFVGINQTGNDRADGSYTVKIDRTAAVAQQDSGMPSMNVTRISQELLDSLPPRVSDGTGNPGDRINFIIVASEEQVTGALKAAGWSIVDKTVRDAVFRGVLASLSKQAYVTMPMSELKLFGRSQDYGYAQGDPLRVVASRHHFRIWKAPFQVAGQTVWIGAGTHDIGFDRDQRNNGVTHKIDPDTDLERDYISRSLSDTGNVALLEYMTPRDTVKEAKTAHGESFHSDGRTLAIYFRQDQYDWTVRFADLFCSVLKQKNPDGGSWSGCDTYIDTKGREDLQLRDIPKQYRVLIVPGFLSSCMSGTAAFQDGQQALKDRYGLTADLLPMPNDSSDDNAKVIAKYITEQTKIDSRKFIVVSYNKGTPDVQTALAKEKGTADGVAAFVSVAGASGGSPIANVMSGMADKWIQQFKMQTCQGDMTAGIKSLAQEVRRAFLASYPQPVVPTYSLAAVSSLANTSKALLETWQLLSKFDPSVDGQLTKPDSTIPGSRYLGVAKADHFAVALPFDKSTDSSIRQAVDHGQFPRAALLESLVRLAIQDLTGN